MSKPKFRHPSHIEPWGGTRKVVSTRAKVETIMIIEKAAKAHNLKPSELYSAILDDYAAWLKSTNNKVTK